MNIKIGKVEMRYSAEGKVKSAEFIPALRLKAPDALVEQLTEIKVGSEVEVKQNADLVFAAWFLKIQEIEEGDRDKFVVDSKIVDCVKDTKGNVLRCGIEYFWKKI